LTEPPIPAEPGAAPIADEEERRRALRRMKAIATGLLVAAAVTFLVARQFDGTFVGYVEAFAEAAMVGALADWFAVTALFRHPLGLPIPHTAIIPERKDDLGRGLGTFVQGNFLSGEVIGEKLRSVGVAQRLGAFLVEPDNAARLTANAGDAVAAAVDVLKDDDVAPVVEQLIRERVAEVPAAAVAARVLDALVDDGHYDQGLDALLGSLSTLLDRNVETVRDRVRSESPWWVPEAVDDRVVAKLTKGAGRFLDDVRNDPEHPVRQQINDRARAFAADLRASPTLAARGEELKAELLDHPAVKAWTSSLWSDLKGALVANATDPDSELRARLADGIVRLGHTLQNDRELQAKVDGWVERTVVYVLDQYRDDVAELISGTIERWDADDAGRRIELQVGRDLQFIRINGTIVGGIVGVLIHAFTQLT
jgi:uncharacterized membrane-anchored protein YjiN (DUF445 family)